MKYQNQTGNDVRDWMFVLVAVALLAGCATFHPEPFSPEKTAAAFDARSLADDHLQAFLETNHVAVPGPHDPWDLKQLTLAAFYFQPALAEARAQLQAAQAATITAAERPNPAVTVTPGYDNGIPGAPSPWIVPVSFDLPIETAGKRRKRIARAQAQAESARWVLAGTIWQTRSGLRAALLNLYAARETAGQPLRQEAAQSNVVRLLEGQFTAGAVSSYEVTQARTALAAAQLARQDAAGKLNQARVEMAHALGVPLRALEGVRFSFAELNQYPRELTRPEVRRQALLDRADVRGALADYAASQAALQLEIANQYPDIHLGPGYAYNAGSTSDNQWDLGLTLTLPVLNHNQVGVLDHLQAFRLVVGRPGGRRRDRLVPVLRRHAVRAAARGSPAPLAPAGQFYVCLPGDHQLVAHRERHLHRLRVPLVPPFRGGQHAGGLGHGRHAGRGLGEPVVGGHPGTRDRQPTRAPSFYWCQCSSAPS